ncbi:hypothetical protein GOV12_05690 [Candidatus Pacearchaeota archaeon]|nr:hypothetical protein [Candidatus Pacearchaeota archaeon]
MKEYAVCYMLGGISQRFNGQVKALCEVGPEGETLIEYSMDQAISAGFNSFYMIVNSFNEDLVRGRIGKNYKGKDIEYVVQEFDESKRDRPWGTGDSVCCVFGKIDSSFVVCAGDNIYGENTFRILYGHLISSENDCAIGSKLIDNLPEKGCVNRGLFELDHEEYVKRINEMFGISRNDVFGGKYNPLTLSSSSVFVLGHRTLGLLNERLVRFKQKNVDDRKVEFILAKGLDELLVEGLIKMKCYETPDKRLGITNPGDEVFVRNEIRL